MKAHILLPAVAAAAIAAQAQTPPPTKVGIIHIQNAIISTGDGQKAAQELQAKFEPRKKSIEGKNSEIASLQQKLNAGANTMADSVKTQLMRDIDQKTKSLQRDSEDAQAEFEQEQNKILNDLGQKLMAVIDKYARDNQYTLILDVSSPQTPVLHAAAGVDITKDIVEMYNKNSPASLPAAPKPAATGAAPGTAAPKPAQGTPANPKPVPPAPKAQPAK